MTYKKIVQTMCKNVANDYLIKLLNSSNIAYRWVSNSILSLNYDEEYKCYLFESEMEIMTGNYNPIRVIVGGTVDDITGILVSCIWDKNKKNILWMDVERTREMLGIREFKVS